MSRRLSRSALPTLALLALGLACTHAQSVASPVQEERAKQRDEAEASQKADDEKDDGKKDEKADNEKAGDKKDAAEKDRADDDKAGSPKHEPAAAAAGTPSRNTPPAGRDAAHAEKHADEKDKSEEAVARDIDVATTPQGLLKPGAQDKVREKLGLGKNDDVNTALRRFQREHDLPATGMLDHETAERLGLAPDDIFEK